MNRHRHPARAFTLVEILVSVGILTVLSVMLMTIANQVGIAWRDGESQNLRRSNGRAILDFLASEMQQATTGITQPEILDFSASTPAFTSLSTHFAASLPAVTGSAAADFNLDEAEADGTNAYLNPHAVFWQSPIARDASRGMIASVGYYVRWIGTQPQLCRFYVDPTNTANFTVFNSTKNDATGEIRYANWVSSTVLDAVSPAAAPDYEGWFADNVIALFVRPLDAWGTPITRDADKNLTNFGYGFDSRRGYYSCGPDKTWDNGTDDDVAVSAPALPPAVEITIVTLDSRALARIGTADVTTIQITAKAKAQDPTKLWDADDGVQGFIAGLPTGLRQSARYFTTTVYLANAK